MDFLLLIETDHPVLSSYIFPSFIFFEQAWIKL